MPDINSVVGECTNFGAFKNATLVMTGKTHGIRLRIEDQQSSLHFMVPPEEIPGILIGKLPSWAFMLFPGVWLQRRNAKKSSVYLTDDQRRDLYDEIIYPAIESSSAATDLSSFPGSFQIAISPGPSEDGVDRVLNWKPCCICKYWEARSKKYGHLGLGSAFGWSGMCGVQGNFPPS
jgi:hypothetical protein